MTQQSQGGAIAADGASAPVSEDIVTTSEDRSFPRRAASAVKSIASKLLTLELCVLVVLAAVVFGPQLFGIQTYGILTGSMEPAIQTGALTFVDTGVSGADLRPGDVAAFDIGEGRICTHRVVSVDPENQTITTKGDANAKWKTPSPDPDDGAALMTYCGAEGSVLTETVTAHAVQAKNFEPDFDEASPWGDVEVEGTDVCASKEAR